MLETSEMLMTLRMMLRIQKMVILLMSAIVVEETSAMSHSTAMLVMSVAGMLEGYMVVVVSDQLVAWVTSVAM